VVGRCVAEKERKREEKERDHATRVIVKEDHVAPFFSTSSSLLSFSLSLSLILSLPISRECEIPHSWLDSPSLSYSLSYSSIFSVFCFILFYFSLCGISSEKKKRKKKRKKRGEDLKMEVDGWRWTCSFLPNACRCRYRMDRGQWIGYGYGYGFATVTDPPLTLPLSSSCCCSCSCVNSVVLSS